MPTRSDRSAVADGTGSSRPVLSPTMSRSHRSLLGVVLCLSWFAAALVIAPQAASAALPPDLWAGSKADFYVAPDPLPAGQPGEIIRLQLITQSAGSTTLRMMYHSQDAAGRDRAA